MPRGGPSTRNRHGDLDDGTEQPMPRLRGNSVSSTTPSVSGSGSSVFALLRTNTAPPPPSRLYPQVSGVTIDTHQVDSEFISRPFSKQPTLTTPGSSDLNESTRQANHVAFLGRPVNKKKSLEDDVPDQRTLDFVKHGPNSVKPSASSLLDDDEVQDNGRNTPGLIGGALDHSQIKPAASPRHRPEPRNDLPGVPSFDRTESIGPIDIRDKTKSPRVTFQANSAASESVGHNIDPNVPVVNPVAEASSEIASNSTDGPLQNENVDAHDEEGMLQAAIQRSKELVNFSTVNNGPVGPLSQADIDDMKGNARTLLSTSRTDSLNFELLETFLKICKEDQERVKVAIESLADQFPENLLSLNEYILDAIKEAEGALNDNRKPESSVQVKDLIEKEDVFSLICMLRAKPLEKRLEPALALMEFGRAAEENDERSLRIREKIRSSGGMQRLLILFRERGSSFETKVVAALAASYLLPSFLEASTLPIPSSLALKIVECLHFLSTARAVTPNGRMISEVDCRNAATAGLMTFWMNHLERIFSSSTNGIDMSTHTFSLSRSGSTGSKIRARDGGGVVFDQRREALELQELVEMTVSLIIRVVNYNDDGVSFETHNTPFAWKFSWKNNLVEQICAVEVARPIAVREGILKTLVEWIQSNDLVKIRPATAALRHLTTITDKYMAGWIHSQMVNEGAVQALVALSDNHLVDPDVRLAIAQVLSSLCVAPHTRAAVVEANCIHFFIGFLYEHDVPGSEEAALFACSALLQLAAGAITRATVFAGEDLRGLSFVSPDKRDSLVDEIVGTREESGAIESFVSIAREHKGKLRSAAVEALRVISEDISPTRRTRFKLCESSAIVPLGITLKDGCLRLEEMLDDDDESSWVLERSLKDIYEALCTLSNIFEPVYEGLITLTNQKGNQVDLSALIKGCTEAAESGAVQSLLKLSTIPLVRDSGEVLSMEATRRRLELIVEAVRSLASLSPLLLSPDLAAAGHSRWTYGVMLALQHVLNEILRSIQDKVDEDLVVDLHVCALQGLGALGCSEPLRVRIIDSSLPHLLQARNSEERTNVSIAANQAFQSLGFAEDEIADQVVGNSPNLLVDGYCLQRSLLLQAMVRSEIRQMVHSAWSSSFSEVSETSLPPLMREFSDKSRSDDGSVGSIGFFENLPSETYYMEKSQAIIQQYKDICENFKEGCMNTFRPLRLGPNEDVSLLSSQVFPLHSSTSETTWILSHQKTVSDTSVLDAPPYPKYSAHVEEFLNYCFPSRLLQDTVLPICSLRPDASYDFRAIMMPKRRYFSFRREGQLLSRLCEKEAATINSSDVHWTLAFTDSSFAGEFSESLVQALYRCPMIQGLSFSQRSRNPPVITSEVSAIVDDGETFVATLVGSLPPWISRLTFQSSLTTTDFRSLISLLVTMGKLAADHLNEDGTSKDKAGDSKRTQGKLEKVPGGSRSQGKFEFFGVIDSAEIERDVWSSFFTLLGTGGTLTPMPLNTLKSLDLSGNNLSDSLCASVLSIVHSKGSSCMLEQLDLSRNAILEGRKVVAVLRHYVERYRSNHSSGRKLTSARWRSPLQVLRLASNGMNRGGVWLEIISLLKRNALELKSLDMSSNDIDLGDDQVESVNVVLDSLFRNTSLELLDISSNKFSSRNIDYLLNELVSSERDSSLSFLSIENEASPLTPKQCELLKLFCSRSRKRILQLRLRERELRRLADNNHEEDVDDVQSYATTYIDHPGPSDNASIADAATVASYSVAEGLTEFRDDMITVLFSAPLVFQDSSKSLRPFAKLDFELERELMWQCLKEASRDIELSFDNATHHRLLATIAKRCSCLHYSGHGHEQYLPLEDGKGGAHWISVEDIKRLISGEGSVGEKRAPFRFVFVSACQSRLAGETFASAGVPHVVCCRQESELKDAAALAFTRQFYLALAIGHTVKDSFEFGRRAVRATPNLRDAENEMRKFVLLPEDGNHDVPIFRAAPVGEWPRSLTDRLRSRRRGRTNSSRALYSTAAKSLELSVRNMMQEDPSTAPPQFFLGREVDMYHVLKRVLEKRLVSVIGDPGVGRSSLVCALCHYINERASSISEIDHIYYVKVQQSKKRERCFDVVKRLVRKILEAEKETPLNDDDDIETMFDGICKSLKHERALIVFDHVELLDNSEEGNEFPMLLSKLSRETKNVRILLTNSGNLGIPSLGEQSYSLGPLNFANTVRLFANLCPYLHTPAERKELFESLVADGEEADRLPHDDLLCESTREAFRLIGEGIPARIESAAYGVTKEQFLQLMKWSVSATSVAID